MKRIAFKNLIVLTALMSLVSCGGKDNKAKSGSGTVYGSTSGSNSSQVGVGQLSGDIQDLFSQLSNSLKCPYGKRLTKVVQFKVQSNGDHTKICGQFQEGSLPGQIGQKYVGVSPYNDFMVVAESVNNGQISGHNVFISMCAQYINNSGTQLPLIDDLRTLKGFQAPNCIVLDKDNFCSHGVIDAAINTYMVSDAYQYNMNGYTGTLNPYEVWTTFFKPTCNGQF